MKNPSGPKLPSVHRIIVLINSEGGVNHARASKGLRPRATCACSSIADARRHGLVRGLDILLLTFQRTQEGSLGREDTTVTASPKRSLGPGRVKLSTSVAGIQQDALHDCSIPSSGRHSDRRITVPPFEGRTQEAKLLALWQASPRRQIICPGRLLFSVFRG